MTTPPSVAADKTGCHSTETTIRLRSQHLHLHNHDQSSTKGNDPNPAYTDEQLSTTVKMLVFRNTHLSNVAKDTTLALYLVKPHKPSRTQLLPPCTNEQLLSDNLPV
jgi:hypothetical protein